MLDDPGADRDAVTRLVLTSGKLYYDIQGHEERARGSVAVARIEQLYPFPVEAAAALTASYPHLRELVWAQEEPQNMGAWRTIRHRLEAAAGRRPRATSAGRGGRARARAIRPRTASSRTGSSARRSAEPRARQTRLRRAARTAAATFARTRAMFMTCRRCAGGSRRQS